MTLAIGVTFLNQTSHAKSGDNIPEFPVHPYRLQAALIGAWVKGGQRDSDLQCLRALCDAGQPDIHYCPHVSERRLKMYVAGKSGNTEKTETAAIVKDTPVYYVWNNAALNQENLTALERMLACVPYLGSPLSMCGLWVVDSVPPAQVTLIPVEQVEAGDKPILMRGFAPMRKILESGDWAGWTTQMKRAPVWVRYVRRRDQPESSPPPRSYFDDMIVFRVRGDPIDILDALWVAMRFKEFALNLWQYKSRQIAPEWLSGHGPDGRKSNARDAHAAFLTLPFVGHLHADGAIKGLALALPPDCGVGPDALVKNLLAAGEIPLSRVGTRPKIRLEMPEYHAMKTLDKRAWMGPAKEWATVTPMVLDRYPRPERGGQSVEDLVISACRDIGLPPPADVSVSRFSMFEGVPPAATFPPLPRRYGKSSRYHIHVKICFDNEVRGPVLIGTGRFLGYGLCRPC